MNEGFPSGAPDWLKQGILNYSYASLTRQVEIARAMYERLDSEDPVAGEVFRSIARAADRIAANSGRNGTGCDDLFFSTFAGVNDIRHPSRQLRALGLSMLGGGSRVIFRPATGSRLDDAVATQPNIAMSISRGTFTFNPQIPLNFPAAPGVWFGMSRGEVAEGLVIHEFLHFTGSVGQDFDFTDQGIVLKQVNVPSVGSVNGSDGVTQAVRSRCF